MRPTKFKRIVSEFFSFLQWRERLVKSLRAMNAGDAADQVIRQVDRLIKNGDRSIRDARVSKVRDDLLLLVAKLMTLRTSC